MGDDTLSIDGSLSEEGFEEAPKLVYKELLLMTAEERAARDALRLAMSGCCLREAWRCYRRLTFAGYTMAPGDPDYRPDCVLYDPEFDRRKYFLGRKYRSLLDGYYKLKEAPSLPYIRPSFPRLLDVPGRHLWQPPPTRRQMPEHDPDYSIPESISGKCSIVRVFNTMFMEDENQQERSTQTWRRDFTELAKKWTKCRDWVDTRPDVKMEHYDIEDIPLDDKGYPVGKSVGICEWCKQDVLPIPTPHAIRHTWDKSKLYCCSKYKDFILGAQNFEKKIQAEYDLKNRLIDIRPNKNKKVPKKSRVSGSEESPRLSKEGLSDEEKRAMLAAKTARIKERDAAERDMKKAKQEQARLDYLASLKDKVVDTFDLPWDPYESKFKHGRIFNDQIFDDSVFHFYDYPEVVMTQSGLFDPANLPSQSQISDKSSKMNPPGDDKEKSSKRTSPANSQFSEKGSAKSKASGPSGSKASNNAVDSKEKLTVKTASDTKSNNAVDSKEKLTVKTASDTKSNKSLTKDNSEHSHKPDEEQ